MNNKRGLLRGDILGLLLAAVLLGGLLLYGAISGMELPFWPSVMVILVNLFAAGRIVMRIHRQRQQNAGTSHSSQR